MQASNKTWDAAIIGGGVAGIAAAVALARSNYRVILLEKRPLLGGRASSWIEHGSGERLDACQHGTMRCCTNLTQLLEWIGSADKIRWQDVIHFLDSAGNRSQIKGSFLPAPLHTAPSFLLHRSLSIRDKIVIAQAMLMMMRTLPGRHEESITIEKWLIDRRQTPRALARFWRPVLVSACNEELSGISAYHGLKVFRDGFLSHPSAFHFGIPSVPLGTLYSDPTVKLLQANGSEVHTHTIVDELNLSGEGGRIRSLTLQNGGVVKAKWYISALQQDLLLKLLPNEVVAADLVLQGLGGIRVAPIAGIHLWFDGRVECPEALALLDRKSDWIFNKNISYGDQQNVTYLSVVISANRTIASMSKGDLLNLVLTEIYDTIPETRKLKLTKSYILREKKATFIPEPGIERLRPGQESSISNLFLAGEWTNTGWPSTMESAARSGFLAAQILTEREGRAEQFLANDLPVSGLNRLLMRR